MAIREYSFKRWDLCGLLTLQPVTSNSAYRNRACVHITSLELTVRKTSPTLQKKESLAHMQDVSSFPCKVNDLKTDSFLLKCNLIFFIPGRAFPSKLNNSVNKSVS